LALALASVSTSTAPPTAPGPYDPDPQHPWNRLHQLLYSRAAADGTVYQHEGPEPPFEPSSRFLAQGPSHQQAIALLDEFLKSRADDRIRDPLKRAVMQRDLWAVFDTTVGKARHVIEVSESGRVVTTDRLIDPGEAVPDHRAERRALQRRLAQVMRRIALTPEQIAALPDNLTQAVRSGSFAAEFDPAHPDRPFLPDLLARDGPWVAVTNARRSDNDGVGAVEHTRFTKGRSVFTTLLRLPGGRRATEAYLKKMDGGNLPEFPAGTETALLRRAFLIDTTGEPRISPLTESVQFRAFRTMDSGLPFEFSLRRADLFAGRAGGLHPLGPNESSYFDFQFGDGDPFEEPKPRPATAAMRSCLSCHSRQDGLGGIHSVQTMYSGCSGPRSWLVQTSLSEEARRTASWAERTYTWGLLQGMWAAVGE
jgi:hypothetical protein